MNQPPEHCVPTDPRLVRELRAAGCVFAEQEARILLEAAADADELDTMLRRRVTGFPLEQIVGWAEFSGMRIAVAPGVFVPRRRSELLVAQAVDLIGAGGVVVDLCCGAGGVGAAIFAGTTNTELHAADIDPTAVRCARENLGTHGTVYEGDLYEALPRQLCGRIHLLVVNAPYVPTGEIEFMPQEARDHEPSTALDGGTDGLDIQRRVAAQAREWLAPGGHVLIETSRRQAPTSLELLTTAGLTARLVYSDELAAPGAVLGTTPIARA